MKRIVNKRVPFKIRHYASISENFNHSSIEEEIAIKILFLIILGWLIGWFYDGSISVMFFLLGGTFLLGTVLLLAQVSSLFNSKDRKNERIRG